MKKILLLMLISLLVANISFAQRCVVLQSASGVFSFNGPNPFIDAYNAANHGDTIYLSGGSFNAPTLFNKKLYVFGAGYHPDSTIATNISMISTNLNFGDSSDYSYLEGLYIPAGILTNYDVSIIGLTIKRCYINGGIHFQGSLLTAPSQNVAIVESIIVGDLTFTNITNSTVQNSIIETRVVHSNSNIFKNNIFMYSSNNYNGVLVSPHNSQFINNVFLNTNGNALVYNINNGNIFQYNMFHPSTNNFGSNSISNNNYVNVPLIDFFVNQTLPTFNFSDNYHLVNPQNYIGNDGTQVGIYGGSFPFKPGGVPSNPHISFKNIASQTNSSGELQIEIHVSAQND
ncbi:MAG: hypothetical protein CVU04_02895 [Bacteroidetes bacterium HGW-Bacteroidetes-20]|nr:MAG: hypothetical protein CVU04_02895 [Bacteroidetes bacterium HGW-Bacteroidetes-20]